MRIGLVNEYFPPFAPGGAEWSTRYLAQRLAQSEQVVVITPNYGAAPHEEMDGFVVKRFAIALRLSGGRRMLPYGHLANPLFYTYSAYQIAQIARKLHLDLLHAQNKQSLVGTVIAGRLVGVPVVATVRDYLALCRYGMCLNNWSSHHGNCDLESYRHCVQSYIALYMPNLGVFRKSMMYAAALYHRIDTYAKKLALRRADAVVTISMRMRDIYVSRGLISDRVETIYNPMPDSAECPAAGRDSHSGLRVLYAGKLSWGKGPHLLIEAIPLVRTALATDNFEVILAGEGPLRAELERRVATSGLGNIVRFIGRVPHKALQELYESATVVVVPSVWQEPFGRVALEALARGCPVVATNRGGLGEIVEDGVTGLLVEPTPKAIAGGILRVMSDSGYRSRVSEAWPRLSARFGADVAAQHLALYHRVLQEKGSSRG